MLQYLHRLILKGLASILVIAVLLPTLVKVGHLFDHHEHKVCESSVTSETHFHELDVDCEFYKFKITDSFFFKPKHLESQVHNYKAKLEDSYYLYFLPHQHIISYLRGPPALA